MDRNDLVEVVLASVGDDGRTVGVKGVDFDHASVHDFGILFVQGDASLAIPWHRVWSFC